MFNVLLAGVGSNIEAVNITTIRRRKGRNNYGDGDYSNW